MNSALTEMEGVLPESHPKMAASIKGQFADCTRQQLIGAREFLAGLTYVRAWQIADRDDKQILRTSEDKLDAFDRFKSLVAEWADPRAELDREQQRALCRVLCHVYDAAGTGASVKSLLSEVMEVARTVNSCRG